jgi:hypothetical protein
MGGVEVVKRTALAAIYAGVALPLTLFQTATTAFDWMYLSSERPASRKAVGSFLRGRQLYVLLT